MIILVVITIVVVVKQVKVWKLAVVVTVGVFMLINRRTDRIVYNLCYDKIVTLAYFFFFQ